MEPEPMINFLAFVERDDSVQVHSISRVVTRPGSSAEQRPTW